MSRGGPGSEDLAAGPGDDKVFGDGGDDKFIAADGSRDVVRGGPGIDGVGSSDHDDIKGTESAY